MIERAVAEEAERVYKWCHDLENSEAFREIILKAIRERKESELRSGLDITKDPHTRAEHHRAYHACNDFLNEVGKRKEWALNTLEAWKQQHGEKLVPLPDTRLV